MTITCTGCDTMKSEADFYPSVLRNDCSNRCKDCCRDAERRLRRKKGIKERECLRVSETERKCGKCREVLPLDAFYPSHQHNRGAWCRVCMRTYYKQRHADDPALHAYRQRVQKARKSAFVRMFKRECEHCGEDHPGVLDLHHRDPSIKEFNLSWAVANNVAYDRLLAEVEKCMVLCANCHRKLHWEEQQQQRESRAAS